MGIQSKAVVFDQAERPAIAVGKNWSGGGVLIVGIIFWTSCVGGFASTHFSKLIAWGQLASTIAPSPPGNSLPFIDQCYSLGYDGIELDVEVSKDEIPVLSHGVLVNGISTEASAYTFDELQQFTLGNWQGNPVRIPSLESALRTNGNRGSILILDLRAADSSATAISNAVRQTATDERLLGIDTYDIHCAQVFKRSLPLARVFFKQYVYPKDVSLSLVDSVAAAGLDGLMVQEPVDGESIQNFVDYVHCKGLKLVLFVHYGVNKLSELQALVDSGVDYILTVHHEMYNEVIWPALPSQLPNLENSFDAAKNQINLRWEPELPYSYRVQTSSDGKEWLDCPVNLDATAAPFSVQCSMPANADCGFYRLKYDP